MLKQLKESPTSTAVELAGKIGVSKSMVECALKRLKALKVISRTGSDKAGKWMIECPLISCWAGIPRRIPVQTGFSPLIRKHCRLFMKHRCMYGTGVGLL